MILKVRYHLSHECINDILRILRECGIETPSSYKSIKTLCRKQSGAVSSSSLVRYICPSCSLSSTSASVCSSCSSPIDTNDSPIHFYNFDLFSQIEQILSTSPNLNLANRIRSDANNRCDIVDGEVYQRISQEERDDDFITLTLNVDGVSPHRGSDLSVWPAFLVINEIDKRKRFSLENVILAAVWPGPGKPSREQTYLLFDHVVEQLKELEKGKVFEVFVSAGTTEERFVKVRTLS